ncbi:MAG: DUF1403 family protein [Defluviimonas sp.]|nr:DUF1403 family protein [Defluviimonas sp.]
MLGERLSLRAAEACVGREGRPERAGELHDAVHLLRPGDLPGPAGEICLAWRRAVERPGRSRRCTAPCPESSHAAMVLETVLTEAPRADVPALVLADATLARALGPPPTAALFSAGRSCHHS